MLPEKIKTENLVSKDNEGIFLFPPGFGLCKLFEQKTAFYLQKPELSEDMGIVEGLEIQSADNRII